MKAFLYARVSTVDQNDGMQLREMRELAARKGYEIEEFTDVASGARDRRPGLDRMMYLVHRGKCDVVIVYRCDRFGRSLQHLIKLLDELESMRVQFVSVCEGFDTTTAQGKLLFHVAAAFAQFERDLIRERTRSGMAHARAQGKHVGRPRLDLDLLKIQALRAAGSPWIEVSRELGVSHSTLKRVVKRVLPTLLAKY